MTAYFQQHWDMLIGRPYGPLAVRLIIQPIVASIFGIRAGLSDARTHRRPYGWRVITRKDRRRALLYEGWRHIRVVFFAALAADLVYQLIEFRWVYPGQAPVVSAALALPSYPPIRSLTNRLASRWRNADRPPTAA
jgi:hypothetical protein